MKKEVPDISLNITPTPLYNNTHVLTPTVTNESMPVPLISDNKILNPKFGIPLNCITVNGETIEIKPTKLKYQRDKTAAFYKILQKIPLVEILSFKDGMIDPTRSSDKVLFDWLIAVTDSPLFVSAHYDDFDSDVVEQMLKIFCRLNHIDEKESKNAKAQMTH